MNTKQWFYSASTGGFLNNEDHGNIPSDAVEITAEEREELLAGDAAGMVIVAGADGRPTLQERQLTEAQVVQVFRTVIQQHLDAAAAAAGYDDIKTAVTYAEEPAVPKFQAEGQAFRAWRSLVWDYAYAQLDAVKGGDRECPSVEAFIEELPALVLPQ